MTGLLRLKGIRSIYPIILNHSRKKRQNQKIKKIDQNSLGESVQISLCFSHYKHHTDITQPRFPREK